MSAEASGYRTTTTKVPDVPAQPASIHGAPPLRPMTQHKSKTVATWLALSLGVLGAHRFYLYGQRDLLAWLHPLPSLAGLLGVLRMRNLGQDDWLASLLIPVLGLMISQSMLMAIVCGLTSDDIWRDKHNPGAAVVPTTWFPVLGVVLALLLGGTVLMGTVAFSGQRFFEWQLGPP